MGRLAARSAAASYEAEDPIAELLSQLSGVRRTVDANAGLTTSRGPSISSQFQQLQAQLQQERRQAQELRLATDQSASASATAPPRSRFAYSAASSAAEGATLKLEHRKVQDADRNAGLASSREEPGRFLLRQCSEEEMEESSCFQAAAVVNRQSKSQFVKDLVLSTLVERVTLKENEADLI
jgi:hypothetical protein